MTPFRRAGSRWAKSPSAAARSAASSRRSTPPGSPGASRPLDLVLGVRATAAVLLICVPLAETAPPDARRSKRRPCTPGGGRWSRSLLAGEGTTKRPRSRPGRTDGWGARRLGGGLGRRVQRSGGAAVAAQQADDRGGGEEHADAGEA